MLSTADFIKEKKAGKAERERKTLQVRVNGRSADFIIPSFAIGCELACTYCYVARHRPLGNSLETFTNLEAIWGSVKKHVERLGPKATPNQCDPTRWTYDIGESTDCLSPAVVDSTKWFIHKFLEETNAKPTFATKLGIGPRVLNPIIEHPRQARVRISLSPAHIIDALEVGTSKLQARLDSINALWDMGYEVHLNFSPVVAYKGWVLDYIKLFEELRQAVRPEVIKDLACEVIFLTHHPYSHEANLQWRPKAEELLWTPQWQETKTNGRGDKVLRYNYSIKPRLVQRFRSILKEHLPEVTLRYIF